MICHATGVDTVDAGVVSGPTRAIRPAVVQSGAPLEVYDRPNNLFVAGFIGSPAMNFVPAVAKDDGTVVLEIEGRPEIAVAQPLLPGSREPCRICSIPSSAFIRAMCLPVLP